MVAKVQPIKPETDGVKWEDPPAIGKGVWVRRLSPLMAEPERWARVSTYKTRSTASSMSYHLRGGKYKTPPGRWEFCSRTGRGWQGVDGAYHVYARYLGPEEA